MRMIGDAETGKFGCVIVWKGDRFSRSRADAAKYKSELKKLGVRVLSATEANVTGPEAVLMDGINEAFAEYFSVELSAKVSRGMTQNVIEGKFNGGRMPLGYKFDENRKIVIDENYAFIIKEAFNHYLHDGMSVKGICRLFKKNGYTDRQGRYIKDPTLHNILKNKHYCGIHWFRDTYNTTAFPPIVSKEDFDMVQKLMWKNRRSRGEFRAKKPFLLKGKVYCLYDKMPLKCEAGTSKSGKIHHYYRCKYAPEKGHPPVTIKKDELEDIIFRELFNFYRNDPKGDLIIDEMTKRFRAQQKDVEPLKSALTRVNERLTSLRKAVEMGADIDIFIDRIKDLKETKLQLEKQINSYVAYTEEEFKEALIDCLNYAFDVERYDDDIAMKKWVVATFINKIYMSEKEIIIMFKYRNENMDDTIGIDYGIQYTNSSVHQAELYTNTPIYCDGRLFGITLDLKPYFERRRARLAKMKNHKNVILSFIRLQFPLTFLGIYYGQLLETKLDNRGMSSICGQLNSYMLSYSYDKTLN
ncbi:MAG: recombinase family protein [Bacilli bacterium]|nr:recombinase family protein [Bacilli bacterium]